MRVPAEGVATPALLEQQRAHAAAAARLDVLDAPADEPAEAPLDGDGCAPRQTHQKTS
jgi:hypothetical protein